MALGTDPSAICLQWPEPETAHGSCYVPNATYPQVADFLANYRKLQEMLNEICALNAELLRRRESLD